MSGRTTLTGHWLALAEALGGVAALAKALGVTRRTVGRWAAGERTPSVLQRRDVAERLRRRGLVSPWR
jgi:transcriptional regulator with XRE-family HTH domain